MKKIVLGLFFFLAFQFSTQAQALEDPKGEVRLNFLNLILLGSVELGYEYFTNHDQSIGVELHLNDRFGYNFPDDNQDFSATSLLFSYNFYFAGNEAGKLYISPYFKYRFGEFTEVENNRTVTTSMNGASIGLIGGYRWNYNNFAFGPFAGIGRGFNQTVNDRFSPVEFKAGFNVGYRF
ncbi:hypothetical protein C943_03333 [Mariniradius saccharolyticus AK6]|uniref:DUF3575 domain-containing protein n=1 Tax=Mariniradius saccharolyticus AK6 TaxID=1239962 RepID=M7YBT1_9BACT|nr:DUF3575 domain-containing protein [Mariniradius saccharolyticus]EMS34646.1 hypothetical protein C943_03333 [Mariniradius saccharolyticus AK6]